MIRYRLVGALGWVFVGTMTVLATVVALTLRAHEAIKSKIKTAHAAKR